MVAIGSTAASDATSPRSSPRKYPVHPGERTAPRDQAGAAARSRHRITARPGGNGARIWRTTARCGQPIPSVRQADEAVAPAAIGQLAADISATGEWVQRLTNPDHHASGAHLPSSAECRAERRKSSTSDCHAARIQDQLIAQRAARSARHAGDDRLVTGCKRGGKQPSASQGSDGVRHRRGQHHPDSSVARLAAADPPSAVQSGVMLAAAVPHAIAFLGLLMLFLPPRCTRSRGDHHPRGAPIARPAERELILYTRRVTVAWCCFFAAPARHFGAGSAGGRRCMVSGFVNLCTIPLVALMLRLRAGLSPLAPRPPSACRTLGDGLAASCWWCARSALHSARPSCDPMTGSRCCAGPPESRGGRRSPRRDGQDISVASFLVMLHRLAAVLPELRPCRQT